MRQQKFNFHRDFKKRTEHGGIGSVGKRKLHRPFDSKRALHLVMRSATARGSMSMARSKFEPKISGLVYGLAKRFHIKISEFANSGNHLHLLVSAKSRRNFQNFLRTLSALVARLVTGAKKGRPKGRFWDSLAYSRVVSFGAELKRVARYILVNKLEAWGIIPAKQRRKFQHFSYERLFELIPISNSSRFSTDCS